MLGDSVVVEMGVISTDFATEAGDGGGAFALGDGVGYDALVGVSSGMPACLLYTSPSPRDHQPSRMPSSA